LPYWKYSDLQSPNNTYIFCLVFGVRTFYPLWYRSIHFFIALFWCMYITLLLCTVLSVIISVTDNRSCFWHLNYISNLWIDHELEGLSNLCCSFFFIFPMIDVRTYIHIHRRSMYSFGINQLYVINGLIDFCMSITHCLSVCRSFLASFS